MTDSASPPRLLLVEDDASLQRFVAMALDDSGIDLVTASSVDEGLVHLRSSPFFLVITDLMLPIRSGFELIDALAAEPRLLGSGRLAVFSAGLSPETRLRLSRPEVWRLLSKPCSVAELLACVHDARAQPSRLQVAAEGAHVIEQTAVARYFGGNTALYRAFRDSCLQQFPADLAAGERAFAAGDLAALRHLAHSLKTVLLTLGRDDDSAVAKLLEDACANGDTRQMNLLWPTLGQRLGDPH